jgi:putative oxidoreductase
MSPYMILPELTRFLPLGLLLLRLIVGLVFTSSGWNHLRDPDGRAKSIGMSKSFTIFLGLAELAGGLGVILGVRPQLAALGLILVSAGAIYKKIFVWQSGFWGEKAYGWHYDLMLLVMNVVIVLTNGGPYVITK